MAQKSNHKFIEPPDLVDEVHYEKIASNMREDMHSLWPKYESEIKHVSQLPDWFNLDDYQVCQKFQTFEWWYQFSVRMDSVMNTGTHFSVGPYQKTKHSILSSKKRVPMLFTCDGKTYNGWYLANQDRMDALKNWKKGKSHFFKVYREEAEKETAIEYVVQPISKGAIYGELIVEDSKFEEPPKIDDKLFAYLERFYSFDHDESDEEAFRPTWIEINPLASKEVLMDAFSAYLDKIIPSKEKTLLKRLGRVEFRRWARNQFLACVDLCLWSTFKRIVIKDEVMAEALKISLDVYRSYVKNDLDKFYYYKNLLHMQCYCDMQLEIMSEKSK